MTIRFGRRSFGAVNRPEKTLPPDDQVLKCVNTERKLLYLLYNECTLSKKKMIVAHILGSILSSVPDNLLEVSLGAGADNYIDTHSRNYVNASTNTTHFGWFLDGNPLSGAGR